MESIECVRFEVGGWPWGTAQVQVREVGWSHSRSDTTCIISIVNIASIDSNLAVDSRKHEQTVQASQPAPPSRAWNRRCFLAHS